MFSAASPSFRKARSKSLRLFPVIFSFDSGTVTGAGSVWEVWVAGSEDGAGTVGRVAK